MNELTQQGIQSYKAGQKIEARRLFLLAIAQDRKDIQAWLWLSAAVDTDKERLECLEAVLKIDPGNSAALRGLEKLDQKRAVDELQGLFKFDPQEPTPDEPTLQISVKRPNPSPPAAVTPAVMAPVEIPSSEPLPPEETENKPDESTEDRRKNRAKKQPGRTPWSIIILILLVTVLCLISLVYFLKPFLFPENPYRPGMAGSAQQTQLAMVIGSATPASPTSTTTPTVTATATLTPTLKPTRTATPTETFVPLGPTIEAQALKIQQQVSDLRGLPIIGTIPFYLVAKDRAEQYLKSEMVTDEFKLELENEKRVMVALGLVKPTYDLLNNALNSVVDNIGGFYEPDKDNIFVLGVWFRGMEHYIYSHEFDHALVDMNFDMEAMGVGSECVYDYQRCQAITALIEGDAEMVQWQWLEQYAGPQDYRDLISWRPPLMALPEDWTPPAYVMDVTFKYEYGHDFVSYFHQRGNWAAVNNLYKNLPTSTEQILHPEKYLAGENPIPVNDPDSFTALGEGWETIDNNVLGEWTTFLVLAYGADVYGQLDDDTAASAAAGWGGDRYYVYYNQALDQTAMSVHWVWDTPKDAAEFFSAFRTHLDERFRGGRLNRPAGECWEMNNQVTCFYTRDNQTLWLIAPEQITLDNLLAQYPFFP